MMRGGRDTREVRSDTDTDTGTETDTREEKRRKERVSATVKVPKPFFSVAQTGMDRFPSKRRIYYSHVLLFCMYVLTTTLPFSLCRVSLLQIQIHLGFV